MQKSMSLVRGVPVYLGANILNAAIPFLLLPILTRVLSPTEYGIVAMFITVVSIFNAFTGLSVHGAISVRYFQLSRAELSEYVTSCIGILVLSTAALVIVIVVTGRWVDQLTGIPVDWLIVAVFTAAMQFLANVILVMWQVTEKPWHYGGAQIGRSLLEAMLSLLFVLVLGMAWQGRLLGFSIAACALGLLAMAWLYKDGLLRQPIIWTRHTRDALQFGLPLIPHQIGGLLIVGADRLIINKLLGSENVGIYMVALQISQVLGLLTDSFNRAYAPWLFKQLAAPSDDAKLKIVKGTYFYFILITMLATMYGLVVPHVLSIAIGPQFMTSADLILPMSLALAFGGCYYMVVNYIFYAGKTKHLAIVSLATGLVNIPLTFLLTQEYMLNGAALAFLASNLLVFTGAWMLSSKVYAMPWARSIGKPTS